MKGGGVEAVVVVGVEETENGGHDDSVTSNCLPARYVPSASNGAEHSVLLKSKWVDSFINTPPRLILIGSYI